MRKLFFSFVLIIGLLCLIGCWDRREMNQLGIVSGLAIDQAEEKDKCLHQINFFHFSNV